jgi:phosphatidylserine/phosphatidylglycerophosphate/cardiolipin synthase-like enzyme
LLSVINVVTNQIISLGKTQLIPSGVPALAPGDKLHHKFGLIDDKIVITGSHNWSKAANHQNDEALVIIDNPTVAAHFDREISISLPYR